MGSYPLSSQAPTHVEVELGCDNYVLENAPIHAMEVSVDTENTSMQANFSSSEGQLSRPKKAKLSADLSMNEHSLSSSPDLHHKLPMRSRQESEDSG